MKTKQVYAVVLVYRGARDGADEDPPAQVNSVHITDRGSVTQCIKVQVQGFPAYGLIDSRECR